MFWKVFYGVLFVSCCVFCNEIEQNEEEHEKEVPYECVSVEQHDENIAPILNTSTENHENIIESIKPQPNEVVSKGYKSEEEEISEEDEEHILSFSGPVKAKGSVCIGANFGHDAPGSFHYPTFSNFVPSFPHYHLYQQPILYPIYIPIPYAPIIASILPGNLQNQDDDDKDKPQNISYDNSKEKSTEKDNLGMPTNKMKEFDEDLNKSKEVQDDNFIDSRENYTNDYDNERNDPDGVVFSGLLPAKGGVRIAARY